MNTSRVAPNYHTIQTHCSIEPVGSKAPTFSTELKSISIEKHFGQSFALLSNAQGFPVPLIRKVAFSVAVSLRRMDALSKNQHEKASA